MKESYLATLRECRREFSRYQDLRKVLNSRRMDYSNHLARLQRAKKEKPQLEVLVRESKVKFEEAQTELLENMMRLDDLKVKEEKGLRPRCTRHGTNIWH